MVAVAAQPSVKVIGALQTGHVFVLTLVAAVNKMIAEIERRGWA